MISADTDPDAFMVQLSVYRSMSGSERAHIGAEMSAQALGIMADGIRMRHRGYSPSEVEWALRRLRVGDEMFRSAWPLAPVLDP